MLSENISKDFFPSSIPRTQPKKAHGETVSEPVGTIRMLELWLEKCFTLTGGDPIDDLFKPMRKVRKDRSVGSHGETLDQYDQDFEKKQTELLQEVYGSLCGLRQILSCHPEAGDVVVPGWIENGIKIM